MAKVKTKSKTKSAKEAKAQPAEASSFSIAASQKKQDSALAALFSSSAGPIKAPPKRQPRKAAKISDEAHTLNRAPDAQDQDDDEDEDLDEVLSEASQEFSDPEEPFGEHEDESIEEETAPVSVPSFKKKRKRDDADDDLEAKYLKKIAREEERELQKLQTERAAHRAKLAKKAKLEQTGQAVDEDEAGSDDEAADEQDDQDKVNGTEDDDDDDDDDDDGDDDDEEDLGPPPLHETLEPSKNEKELQKAQCTVFLANVSTTAITDKAAKKALMAHLSSFLPHLPADTGPHKLESIRFRSTAFSSHIPRKAAFARKDVMDETSKSTHAYAVYSTKTATREAAKRLNGSVVLGRHLRVDEVAHPMKQDHRRCVFVGNLGFVDDETRIRESEAAEGKPKRKPQNGDVEEGLWVQFSKAGKVESVRVVRDPKTRIGKGFAYVQFADENGVEAALLFNEKKYPPLLPRKLRVTRAKKFTGEKDRSVGQPRKKTAKTTGPKDDEKSSLQGRVAKMLGRAGAAVVKRDHRKSGPKRDLEVNGKAIKSPENIIFEGTRATEKSGKSGLRLGGSGRKKDGKRNSRATKRSASWKQKAKAGKVGSKK